MEAGGNQCIVTTSENGTLVVCLSNPPDNLINPAMLEGLDQAMDAIETDEFHALVVTGAGKVFSKGVDLEALKSARDAADIRRVLILSNAVFSRIARSPKPTVAAINGACLGGGFELALACHFRVCAKKSRLGLPEVWINLVPGLGGYYRLSKLVGGAKALELVALGDLMTAEESLRLNVVNRVFPREDFAEHVSSFVKALCLADARVIREVLRLASCSSGPGEEDNIRQGMESFAKLASCLRKT
jgi:enoyl-CoA hydratase/carnithine racemase